MIVRLLAAWCLTSIPVSLIAGRILSGGRWY